MTSDRISRTPPQLDFLEAAIISEVAREHKTLLVAGRASQDIVPSIDAASLVKVLSAGPDLRREPPGVPNGITLVGWLESL
jgi:hypothetical protein